MRLDRNFLEFIECCAAHEVRFLIVGGYALAAHGHPRYTKDLDVDPTAVIQMGQPPHRIDVLSTIPFIGQADFIANKLASGRLQDLADVDALQDE